MKSASMYNKMCRSVFNIARHSRIMRKQAVPAEAPGANVALKISSTHLFLDTETHILLEKTALREVSKVPLPPFPWTLKHAFRFKQRHIGKCQNRKAHLSWTLHASPNLIERASASNINHSKKEVCFETEFLKPGFSKNYENIFIFSQNFCLFFDPFLQHTFEETFGNRHFLKVEIFL